MVVSTRRRGYNNESEGSNVASKKPAPKKVGRLPAQKIDKTNQEYGFELRSNTLRAPFAKITNIFENVYYGNFPVTQPVFEKASTDFQKFKSLVPTHATA